MAAPIAAPTPIPCPDEFFGWLFVSVPSSVMLILSSLGRALLCLQILHDYSFANDVPWQSRQWIGVIGVLLGRITARSSFSRRDDRIDFKRNQSRVWVERSVLQHLWTF
jgi:hypothetical protein